MLPWQSAEGVPLLVLRSPCLWVPVSVPRSYTRDTQQWSLCRRLSSSAPGSPPTSFSRLTRTRPPRTPQQAHLPLWAASTPSRGSLCHLWQGTSNQKSHSPRCSANPSEQGDEKGEVCNGCAQGTRRRRRRRGTAAAAAQMAPEGTDLHSESQPRHIAHPHLFIPAS